MEWLLHSVLSSLKILWSYVVAIARLIMWTIIFFFSGLQRTLFMKGEVAGVDFKVIPLLCDREELDDKLAYLDKLCIENPDLVEGMISEEDVIPLEEEHRIDDEDDGENEA